jgi:hypothetical protein
VCANTSPDASVGELHCPASAVEVCDSTPAVSQLTQVTVPPARTTTSAGMNAKLLIATTVLPGTGLPAANRHSPGSPLLSVGPLEEKHAAVPAISGIAIRANRVRLRGIVTAPVSRPR